LGGERRQLRNEGVQNCNINFGREMNIYAFYLATQRGEAGVGMIFLKIME
jgi:hypothetical protein